MSSAVSLWPRRRLRLQHDLEAALEVEALAQLLVDRRAREPRAARRRRAPRCSSAIEESDESGARPSWTGRLARARVGLRHGILGGLVGRPARRSSRDGRDGAPVERDDDAGRDLDLELVLVRPRARRAWMPPAVMISSPTASVVLHRLRASAAGGATGSTRKNQPSGEEDGDDDDQGSWCRGAPVRRVCRRRTSPRSIASRARRVSSSRKRRLWSESRRSPSSSFWLTRWRM